MAEYIKINTDKQSTMAEEMGHPMGEASIRIFCASDLGLLYFRDEIIEKDNRIKIYEIPTIEQGGGPEIPTLLGYILTGLIVSFALVSKGFFDELGKALAQSIVRKFESLKRPGAIYIMLYDHGEYEISLFVPSGMREDECDVLAKKINEYLKELSSTEKLIKIYLTFDRTTKEIVVISDLPG